MTTVIQIFLQLCIVVAVVYFLIWGLAQGYKWDHATQLKKDGQPWLPKCGEWYYTPEFNNEVCRFIAVKRRNQLQDQDKEVFALNWQKATRVEAEITCDRLNDAIHILS